MLARQRDHALRRPEISQFGSLCCDVLQIPAAAFRAVDSTVEYTTQPPVACVPPSLCPLPADYLYATSSALGSGEQFWANVTLPEGARILYLDLYYDDQSATENLTGRLLVTEEGLGDFINRTEIASVASVGTGGPSYNFAPLDHTYLQNGSRQYRLTVGSPNPSLLLGFRGMDLWWQRQVSPPPSVATFNDVSLTHPFHPFVEAFFDAGITGGCGSCADGPNCFCPANPVTRAEMAVFLGRALGLHFSP